MLAVGLLQQLFRYADLRDHIHHVALRIQQAHKAGVGSGQPHHLLQKAGGGLFQLLLLVQQGGDGIQGAQLQVVVLQLAGFFLHLFFHVLQQFLQALCHGVEAGGEHAEFVLAVELDAAVERALAEAQRGVVQLADRQDHHQVEQVDHGQRADQGKTDQQELEHAQHGGVVCIVLLDQAHQLVDVADKAIDLGVELFRTDLARMDRFQQRQHVVLPLALDDLGQFADFRCVGQQQRA